jgi:chorismate mutase
MGAQIQGSVELLQKHRKEIDQLDTELLRLLNQRAMIVLQLAAIKKSSGLPAYDGQREQEVLQRICRESQGPLEPESVVTLFRAIIHEFRRIGEAAMRQMK